MCFVKVVRSNNHLGGGVHLSLCDQKGFGFLYADCAQWIVLEFIWFIVDCWDNGFPLSSLIDLLSININVNKHQKRSPKIFTPSKVPSKQVKCSPEYFSKSQIPIGCLTSRRLSKGSDLFVRTG